MAGGVRWDGLKELHREFQTMAEQLAAEAEPITRVAAEEAAQRIRDGYPRRSGQLKDGVRVVQNRRHGQYAPGWTVINTAPHAYMFEVGTMARHNGIGARGQMAPGNVFIPNAMARRRVMVRDELPRVLEAHGFEIGAEHGDT